MNCINKKPAPLKIVFGFLSKKILKKLAENKENNEKIYCSDGMLTAYADNNITGIEFLSIAKEFQPDIFNQNEMAVKIYNLFFERDVLNLLSSIRFTLSYKIVEIMRIIISLNTVNRAAEIHCSIKNKDLFEVLSKHFTKEFSNATIKYHETSLADSLEWYKFNRNISWYGDYRYIKYIYGLPIKMFFKKSIKHDEKKANKLILCTGEVRWLNNYFGGDDHKIYFLDSLKFSVIKYLLNYSRYLKLTKKILNRNRNWKAYIDANHGLGWGLRFIWLPCLLHYRLEMKKHILRKKIYYSECKLIQATDASPHTYLNAKICIEASIGTAVSQHGIITEPLLISNIISDEAHLNDERSYDSYRLANPKKNIYLHKQQKENIIKKFDSRQCNIWYIFTTSYTGMNLDRDIKFNYKLIDAGVSAAGNQNNVIVKIHPSEKKSFYKLKYPKLEVNSKKFYEMAGNVRNAICGPSTTYWQLLSAGFVNVHIIE